MIPGPPSKEIRQKTFFAKSGSFSSLESVDRETGLPNKILHTVHKNKDEVGL